MLAKAYQERGFEVLFLTAPYSWLFSLKKHHFNDMDIETNHITKINERLKIYVHATPFHIFSLKNKCLNKLTKYLYKVYQIFSLKGAKDFIRNADQIIFESTPGLFLFDQVKKLNPNARYVYRVSDDLELVQAHPSLLIYERTILNRFDLVSTASTYVLNKLRSKTVDANIKLHYHGLDKSLFDQEFHNPYTGSEMNALFIGVANLDYEFLKIASEIRKDIKFHIIGPLEKKITSDNIIYYGEMPFKDTIPFIKFADIALHTIVYYPGAESLSESSLKSIQYSYCQLPIIAPAFLKNTNKKLFIYSSYKNIESALNAALSSNLNVFKIYEPAIYSWMELSQMLDVD
ncbi:glucuronosyltransferase [Robertkochia solimangrovi]|nr:glucuronosyltransferase [Robertkochia solimangrovi]